MRGPVLMLAALALFAALDTAGKLLAQDGFGFAQVVMLRYASVLPVAAVLLLWTRTTLFDGTTKLHALRGLAMLLASTGFYLAFASLPLAEGYLVFFTSPFLTMAAARLVLGEHDLVLEPGEAAEFDTRIPHWFGATSAGPVEFLSLIGRQGERAHLRASPRAAPP